MSDGDAVDEYSSVDDQFDGRMDDAMRKLAEDTDEELEVSEESPLL